MQIIAQGGKDMAIIVKAIVKSWRLENTEPKRAKAIMGKE